LNKRPAQRSPRHTTPFLEIRPLPQRCHFRPPPAATFNRRQQKGLINQFLSAKGVKPKS